MTATLDRIRASLVGLRMPRALEALETIQHQLERGELSALDAIDGLLAQEHANREGRRIGVALKTARLTPPKTLESFDFSFQPSLDRNRIQTLAQLDFVARAEVVHRLGPSGTGKSHLATALLDRLLHHAVVLHIDGASCRLRAHADLVPEHARAHATVTPPP